MTAASIFAAVEERELERFCVSALAIGVLSTGEREERSDGVAPETTFRVASITKPLVAALALRLVEEGRLALDEPLTGLRLPWPGITLLRLLSHQAVLARKWSKPVSAYGEGEDVLQRPAADEAVGAPVPPGRLFVNANPRYWLTGAPVERAADMPFEHALRELVLQPLGMERTGSRRSNRRRRAAWHIRARGVRPAGSGPRSATCSDSRRISLAAEGPSAPSRSGRCRRRRSRWSRRVTTGWTSASGAGAENSRSSTAARSTACARSCSSCPNLRPVSPTRFVVRGGAEKGDWVELFENRRLLRYDTLHERVA